MKFLGSLEIHDDPDGWDWGRQWVAAWSEDGRIYLALYSHKHQSVTIAIGHLVDKPVARDCGTVPRMRYACTQIMGATQDLYQEHLWYGDKYPLTRDAWERLVQCPEAMLAEHIL